MGSGESKPVAEEPKNYYQIVTPDGKLCLAVDPSTVVEDVDESKNRKQTSLGLKFVPCNPDDPWQMWSAAEDGPSSRKFGLLGKHSDYSRNARYVSTPGKTSVRNVGADGVSRYLFSKRIETLYDAEKGDATLFVKWFPDDYAPDSGWYRDLNYKSTYRHWELFKVDSVDPSKIQIKYFVSDNQFSDDTPALYVNACVREERGAAVLAECVPDGYLLFEPKGRRSSASPPAVTGPSPGPSSSSPGPSSSSPGPSSSSPGPSPSTYEASPSTYEVAPSTYEASPSTYEVAPAPAPAPAGFFDTTTWWLIIGGGIVLCIAFVMLALVFFIM
jgi:hypothetical protein